MFTHEYPYNDMHEFNLDSLLRDMNNLEVRVNEWMATNNLKFANPIEWNNLRTYLKNTIVKGENGNTYLAIKDVPSGIDTDNEEYWLKIGDYDAGLHQIERNIKMNNSGVVSARNRRFVIIGDSYTQYLQWSNIVQYRLGIHSYDWIVNGLGATGFSGNVVPSVETKFIDLLNQTADMVGEPDTITDVIVVGGANDAYIGSFDELPNAITTFVNRARALYPNSTIHIGMVGYSGYDGDYTIGNGYVRVLSAYSGASNACYMKGIENIMRIKKYRDTDNVHPNTLGYERIAEFIYNYICTGDGGAVVDSASNAIFDTMTLNDITHLRSSGVINVNFGQGGSTLNLDGSTGYPLVSNLDNTNIYGHEGYNKSTVEFEARGVAVGNNNVGIPINFKIKVEGTTLKAFPYAPAVVGTSSTGYYNGTVWQMMVMPISVIIPTIRC